MRKQSDEEREHALMLIQFQTLRGGRVQFESINVGFFVLLHVFRIYKQLFFEYLIDCLSSGPCHINLLLETRKGRMGKCFGGV